MTAMTSHGLGRLHAPDERDQDHHLRSLVEGEPLTGHRSWADASWFGDQGNTSECVGYSWAHFIDGARIVHSEDGPYIAPTLIYNGAQENDEWPGTDYEGTSVRGGAKYLRSLGVIGEYLWAFDVETIARTLLTQGPVVVGTNWYWGMFDTRPAYDALGSVRMFIFPDENDELAGGHAYLLNGVNVERQTFRMKNSWGTDWGMAGRASISWDTMDRLINEDGEACMALEIR